MLRTKNAGIDFSAIPENREDRDGNCYELSARFTMANTEWKVVHATLYPNAGPFKDKPFPHAFCELNDTLVYDPVFDRFYLSGRYYKFTRVTNPRKYSVTEATKEMLRTKMYGPWE